MRNDEELGADLERGKVEFARLIFKDAQVGDFARKKVCCFGRIVVGDADEDDQTAVDSADGYIFDGDSATGDAF